MAFKSTIFGLVTRFKVGGMNFNDMIENFIPLFYDKEKTQVQVCYTL